MRRTHPRLTGDNGSPLGFAEQATFGSLFFVFGVRAGRCGAEGVVSGA
jgi:hypothetical protein